MSINIEYRLNISLLNKILIERGWGIEELREATQISRTHFYRMSMQPENRNFSPVGFESRKKLRKAFPDVKSLFLPIIERKK